MNIAVRKIVEAVLRCGDIDSRYSDSSAMYAGARAHRKIQSAKGPEYQKEVPLRCTAEIDGIPALIQGRADGVISRPDGSFVIDEIKTTTLPFEILEIQREMHLGQAKAYAYMLLSGTADDVNVGVQLTYFQLETEEIQIQNYEYTKSEIEEYWNYLLKEYAVWLRFEREWRELRNNSISELKFPFPAYRKGQRELAAAVYRTINESKSFYAQAPTGIGKTLSTLFPSIISMGQEKCDKIFYLTAKTVTRAVAEDAVRLMSAEGLRLKTVTLRAKEKLCPREEKVCSPDFCPHARGHYDRVGGAVLDILQAHDLITPEIILEYALKHSVCPHEFALDIALWADVVVGDYNHVFDPVAFLHRFFSEPEGAGEYIFLIDEAHNMPDRVREMYSASLKKSSFLNIRKILTNVPSAAKIRKTAGEVNKYLLTLRKESEDKFAKIRTEKERDAGIFPLLCQYTEAMEEWLAKSDGSGEYYLTLLESFFEISFFQTIFEVYTEAYVTLFEVDGSDLEITLLCLDPSEIIAEKLRLARAAVFFSATLTPHEYYREVLGGEPDDYVAALPSPFEQENLLLLCHSGISTKFVDRGRSISQISDTIHALAVAKPGNYLVFFPSYTYLKQVFEDFTERFPAIPTIIQSGFMNDSERAEFLNNFTEEPGTLFGFSVLGGIFSEGIDLKGRRLVGAVIVGVGLPGISPRQDEIKNYYNKKNGAGFDFAYVYPGMNKVLQAAGRVIRTETDRGVVLLIDSRFASPKYKSLMPAHWSDLRYIKSCAEIKEAAENFQIKEL